MKGNILFLYLLFLVSCSGNYNNSIVVRNIGTKLVIDGIKEKTWENSESNPISCIYSGEAYYESEKDIGGKFNVLYNSTYIYFFFEIADNIKYTHEIPTINFDKENWHPEDYDHVSIMFDNNHDKKIDFKNIGDDCKLGINYNIENCFAYNITNMEAIKFKQSETTDKYNFEIQIPWSSLNINPWKNRRIGFCVRVYDNDKRFITPKEMDILGGKETEIVWPETTYFRDYYKSIGFLRFE
jgi:hypothetical protein